MSQAQHIYLGIFIGQQYSNHVSDFFLTDISQDGDWIIHEPSTPF